MKNTLQSFAMLCLSFLLFTGITNAQTVNNIAGKVIDGNTNEPIIGVNIIVQGTTTGTTTDINGKFNFEFAKPYPVTLVFSSIGYSSQSKTFNENVTELTISLSEEATLLGSEVVVSASRVEETILESPVTVEKMDILAVQASPAPDFYDGIAQMKGVASNSGSLTFTAINTRGFATIANTRFVQLVDGMDTSAPLLNFPTGNLVGIPELDVESVELVPGAASALYGPNAFNGIMIMKSKNPFEYQGLSASVKYGVTSSQAQERKTGTATSPLVSFNARYAKAFNNKLAFKVNFAYLDAEDWTGNDYTTDRARPGSTVDLSQNSDFDGLNLYGDEVNVAVNLAQTTGIPQLAPLGTINFHRTGIREEDLIEDNQARSIKIDGALHYKLTDNIEASLQYKYGGGSAIYQGSEKYVITGFSQTFLKAEVTGDNFFVRAYNTNTDDGDSYNLTALGTFANEALSRTSTTWAPEYVGAYLTAIQGGNPAVAAGDARAAHAAARAFADRNIYNADGTPKQAYFDTINRLRTVNLNENGAAFVDDSKLYHAEFNYDFKNQIDFIGLQVGGNFRRYDLSSEGTIFNEPIEDGKPGRVGINEYGVYTQLSKALFNDKLKLKGSIRYDKNENFEGRFTPRISGVYSLDTNKKHNIRASFQTGFRNPDTQAQFIWFPTGGGILLGSTEANAGQYNIHNGGAYTQDSYNAFIQSGGSFGLDAVATGGDNTLLQTANIDFVKPERLQAIEVGYKGLIGKKVLVDLNYYTNRYDDFITQSIVYNKNVVNRNGTQSTDLTGTSGVTSYILYNNAKSKINSQGIGLGVTAQLPKDFNLEFSYNWAKFEVDESKEDGGFRAGFNTPENRFNVSLSNRKITKNLGASVSFRYSEAFEWQGSFGDGTIPAYGILSASVSYKVPSIKSIIKLGGTNLLNDDYRPNIGSGFVGQQYFVSLTFDEFLK